MSLGADFDVSSLASQAIGSPYAVRAGSARLSNNAKSTVTDLLPGFLTAAA